MNINTGDSFLDFAAVLTFLGVIQGFFLGAVLLKRKERSLAALIIAMSVAIFYSVIIPTGICWTFPHLLYLEIPVQLILGPLFYFYVIKAVSSKIGKRGWLHFLPALGAIIVEFPFYILTGEAKIELFRELADGVFSLRRKLLWGFFIIQYLTYLLLSIKRVRDYEKKIRENFSNIEKYTLRWLWTLLIIYLAVIFLQIILTFFFFTGTSPIYILMGGVVSIAVYYMGYRFLIHPVSTLPQEMPPFEKDAPLKLSGPAESESLKYKIRLEELMERDKLYLDPDLTLDLLCRSLQINKTYLSRILNQFMKKSFYDFVNHYRVEEVKERLRKFPETPILEIAFAAGFNSKTAFNKIFKALTRMTPSEFKKSTNK